MDFIHPHLSHMSICFTVTGTVHQLGQSFIKPGDKVTLVKEPDNQFDKEAIAVKMDVLGKIGYVANSYNTRRMDPLE